MELPRFIESLYTAGIYFLFLRKSGYADFAGILVLKKEGKGNRTQEKRLSES